jgi:hypothetical protein
MPSGREGSGGTSARVLTRYTEPPPKLRHIRPLTPAARP